MMNQKRENKDMKYKVLLVPEEVGGYSIFVPAFPGCMSQGETREEALANIKEAIGLFIDVEDEDLVNAFPNSTEIEIEV